MVQRSKYASRLSIDLVVITICFLVAHLLSPVNDPFHSKRIILQFLYIGTFWYFSSQASALYNDFLSRSLSQEVIAVVKTILLQNAFIIIAHFFISRNPSLSKWFIIFFLSLQLFLLPITKWIVRWYYSSLFHKINKKSINLLIIGAGQLGMDFHKTVASNYQFGYKVAGFLDDERKAYLNGEYLGHTSDLQKVLSEQEIDEVIIALPNNAVDKIQNIVSTSEEYAKRVRIIPDYYKLSPNISISTFGNLPLISLRKIPLDDVESRFFKRAFDIAFSLVMFSLVFIWIFPIIMLLIKLTSRGPIFYLQERWGLNGKKIMCFKFRSMYCKRGNEVDENGKFRPTEKNDPRITRIGAFLRKHNLDELPQFLNVLKGEMSIVGPRPHASLQNEEMRELVNNYMLRHLVRPGITGWAQIHGYRGETKQLYLMQKRIDFDIWYITNWSFWLDCQIIIQTVINMIKGEKNAY